MTPPLDPLAEIKTSFFFECDELLEALQDGLELLQNGAGDDETINEIFRAVHSIKGSAGAFGLDALVTFAHCYEGALEAARAGQLEIDPPTLKLCFLAADHLSDIVHLYRDGADIPVACSDTLLADFEKLLNKDGPSTCNGDDEIAFVPTPIDLQTGAETSDAQKAKAKHAGTLFYITFKPFVELFDTGNEPHVILRALAELGSAEITCDNAQVPTLDLLAPDNSYLAWTVKLRTLANKNEIASIFEFVEGLCSYEISLSPLHPVIQEPSGNSENTNAEISTPTAPKQTATPTQSIIRVNLERIERLVNLVGELVINQSMLSQSLETIGLPPHGVAKQGLDEFQRLTRDIQDSVMMIRAQPVKPLFQRMSRVVRETSAASGKDVRLVTQGEDTEIDKTVIEHLAGPLTHMIRNAIDHGIECPADRRAAGKDERGQIKLSAVHKSGRVVIEISDDGNGIDRQRILETAVQKGLVSSDKQLSDAEIDGLLFQPGFSTSSAVSDLSGRGVGMDVVRTEIQALGGRVSLTSTFGQGTCFSVSLPLTLAVLDGMVIDVAGETLVVPLPLVIETLPLAQDDVHMLQPKQPVVFVRNQFVPLVDLAKHLGFHDTDRSFDNKVGLLIKLDDGSYAVLGIDAILDQRQVVIKGMDNRLTRAPGIAAATIMGDGKVALILDPSDIAQSAVRPNVPLSVQQPEGELV